VYAQWRATAGTALQLVYDDSRFSRLPPLPMTPERPDASRPPPADPDWQEDTPYPSAAPEHDFAMRRVTLIVLLVAAIVLPSLYVAVMAYSDLRTREATARDVTMRTARVAEEHALKVFDLSETLDARIVDLVQDLDDTAVRHEEADIHDALNTIGGGYPQVAAVSIFGASGMLLANSLYYPAPYASIADRDDFVGIRDGKVIEHISRVMPGPLRLKGPPVFNTGVARRHSDGTFAGMVSIALKSSYFSAFYRDLLGGANAPMTMALTRTDGAVLASYPPLPAGATTPAAASQDSGDPRAGVVRVNRDGGSEIVAYRQVGSYPVFVSCAYRTSAIWREWYQHLSVLFLSMFVPSIALWSVIWLSLKRLRAEEEAWERWQAEASMRRSIESAYRQSRKMEALGNLVGSVAHDFNNLLMIISSNVQIARRRGVQHLDTELAAIERALKNGQSLTRQLLGVARKQPLRSETIDVAQWLAACRELLKTSLGSKSSFVVETAPDLWPIRVDVAELELAVINLAVNARDAMPHGGRFTIRAHNLSFRHEDGFPLTGDFVQLALDDTGAGMPPDVLARAFEPLFTTKAKGMGTGLGLPQVFAFCERSGGLATIDSAVGAGTSVRLYLPRARAGDAPRAVIATDAMPTDRSAEPAADGLRILLVEDNSEVAAGTEALLQLLGHDVAYASNADDALRLLHEAGDDPVAPGAFDLVISDIHMPGKLNGIDLAETIEHGPLKLPVILVTGYAEELDRTRRVSARVLSKPFDIALLDGLLQTIRDARNARVARPGP
jgi:signal transduction histidine kinase